MYWCHYYYMKRSHRCYSSMISFQGTFCLLAQFLNLSSCRESLLFWVCLLDTLLNWRPSSPKGCFQQVPMLIFPSFHTGFYRLLWYLTWVCNSKSKLVSPCFHIPAVWQCFSTRNCRHTETLLVISSQKGISWFFPKYFILEIK